MKLSVGLVLVVALAAALRFYGLAAESLWLDEAHTVWRIGRGIGAVLPRLSGEAQGPLYYAILKVWCAFFGTGEAALRVPSAIIGVLTVPVAGALAGRWFGPRAGLATAFLIAINPFAIHYAQEARPYALFLLLSVASLDALARLSRPHRRRDVLLYALWTEGALYSHAYGVFLLIAQAAVFAIQRRWAEPEPRALPYRRYAALLGLVLAAAIPAALQYAAEYGRMAEGTSNIVWLPRPTLGLLGKALVEYFMGKAPAAATVLLALAVLPARAVRDRRLLAPVLSLAAIGASFLVAPWLISLLGPTIFFSRYTIPGLAAVVAAAGASVSLLRGVPRAAAVALLVLLSVAPLARYYTLVDKDPWRLTAEIITGSASPGDLVVPFPRAGIRPLRYYLKKSPEIALASLADTSDVDPALAGVERVWLVESYPGSSPANERMAERLASGFERGETIVVNDRVRINPGALHVIAIRVTPFVRKTEPR